MGFGYGSFLGLEAPPAPAKPVDGQRAKVYQPELNDASALRIDTVTDATITAAINSARNGNIRPLADIYDLMLVHPILGGIVEQRVAGAKGVEFVWQAPNDSPRAQALLDETIAAIPTQSTQAVELRELSVMSRLRGGALAENVWELVGGEWAWKGATPVPQQRMRFDPPTRGPAFAANAFSYSGKPLTEYEPGTWLYFGIHEGIAHFGLRGYLRRLIGDWFSGNRIGTNWAYTINRWGDPPIDFASDDEAEREQAGELGRIGPGMVISHRLSTQVKPIQVAGASGTNGMSHHEYETSREQRAAICLLGATQMVSVQTKEGSQNSAPGHAAVRQDILQSDADAYCKAMNSVARDRAVLNHGLDVAADAPSLQPLWREPVDVSAELDNAKKADELGLDLDLDALYGKIGYTRPETGKETLREARAKRAPAAGPAPATNLLPFPAGKGNKP